MDRLALVIFGTFMIINILTGVTSNVCLFGEIQNSGSCDKCRCFSGEEFDRSTQLLLNKTAETGFLECPPCVPCPDGRYREPGYPYNRCRKCRKDCDRLNKHWVTFCGGTSSGLCGHCYTGFVQSSIDPNSACVNRSRFETPTTPSPNVASCPDGFYKSEGLCHQCTNCSEANRIVSQPCGGNENGTCGDCLQGFVPEQNDRCIQQRDNTEFSELTGDPPEDTGQSSHLLTYGLRTFFGIFASIMLAAIIVAIFISRMKSKSNPAKATVSVSRQHILDPGSKSTVCDIEPDGPTYTNHYVRAERPEPINSIQELLALIQPSTFSPSVRFTDTHCHELSKLISGDDKVRTFFHELGVPETIYNPYRDFFFNDKISFADYVRKSMIGWCQKETINATLDKVCTAMNDSDFDSKVPDLMAAHARIQHSQNDVRLPEENDDCS